MNEATRQRDEELAKLIEWSRQLGPMTSEKQREQRISWVYGNCKLSNPDITREMVENVVDTPTRPDTFCDACYDQQQGFGKCPDHSVSSSPQPTTPTYINPLAALRRERKVKPGKAAALLGISRQRLHVVEHATKPLRCMDRLLAKAAEVWPVVDEATTKTTVTK